MNTINWHFKRLNSTKFHEIFLDPLSSKFARTYCQILLSLFRRAIISNRAHFSSNHGSICPATTRTCSASAMFQYVLSSPASPITLLNHGLTPAQYITCLSSNVSYILPGRGNSKGKSNVAFLTPGADSNPISTPHRWHPTKQPHPSHLQDTELCCCPHWDQKAGRFHQHQINDRNNTTRKQRKGKTTEISPRPKRMDHCLPLEIQGL